MSLETTLRALVKAVLDEAGRNEDFRLSLEVALNVIPKPVKPRAPSRKAHREPAVFDPVSVAGEGEATLRERLATLDLAQLKVMVGQFGMDPGARLKSARKPERFVEEIVRIALERAVKGLYLA